MARKTRKRNRRRHRKYAVKNRRRFTIAIGIMALLIILLAVVLVSMVTGGDKKADDSNAKAPTEATEPTYPAAEGYLILVNKHNGLPEGYEPAELLLPDNRASDRPDANQNMEKKAAEAFNQLSADAKAEGMTIVVTTAYRNEGLQTQLYNNYVANYGKDEADTFSARPGFSEHQTGLAADVSSPSVGYQLTEDYINTTEGQWLADNCYKYGFIIRFPKDKESITGYTYEPWHIRYVGKKHAEKIYQQGITLEEYLGQEPADSYLE